jgi:hypothetical protein
VVSAGAHSVVTSVTAARGGLVVDGLAAAKAVGNCRARVLTARRVAAAGRSQERPRPPADHAVIVGLAASAIIYGLGSVVTARPRVSRPAGLGPVPAREHRTRRDRRQPWPQVRDASETAPLGK